MHNNNNTQPSPLLSSAIEYATKGWQIIPLHAYLDGCCTCEKPDCGSPAKHPLTARGLHDATTDADTIERWWAETQGFANIGVVTGELSGLVVVDIDAKSGGLETLARLERTYGVARTPTADTGGGGKHYFFCYPLGYIVGNRTGIQPGIDVRGDGGYVVAAPSAHASGRAYTWAVPPDEPLAALPPWLLALITGKTAAGSALAVPQPPRSPIRRADRAGRRG